MKGSFKYTLLCIDWHALPTFFFTQYWLICTSYGFFLHAISEALASVQALLPQVVHPVFFAWGLSYAIPSHDNRTTRKQSLVLPLPWQIPEICARALTLSPGRSKERDFWSSTRVRYLGSGAGSPLRSVPSPVCPTTRFPRTYLDGGAPCITLAFGGFKIFLVSLSKNPIERDAREERSFLPTATQHLTVEIRCSF